MLMEHVYRCLACCLLAVSLMAVAVAFTSEAHATREQVHGPTCRGKSCQGKPSIALPAGSALRSKAAVDREGADLTHRIAWRPKPGERIGKPHPTGLLQAAIVRADAGTPQTRQDDRQSELQDPEASPIIIVADRADDAPATIAEDAPSRSISPEPAPEPAPDTDPASVTARKPPPQPAAGIAYDDPDCTAVPVWLQDSYPGCRPDSGELGSIAFDQRSVSLSTMAMRELESIAATLRQNASMHVELKPTTFAAAVKKRDRLIAASRAEAVQLHLSRLGVSVGRLRVGILEESSSRKAAESPSGHGLLATGLVAINITDGHG